MIDDRMKCSVCGAAVPAGVIEELAVVRVQPSPDGGFVATNDGDEYPMVQFFVSRCAKGHGIRVALSS